MPFLALDKVNLYYRLIGAGPPVVFVSGWTMSSEYWHPIVEILSSSYRCLIYDGRGFGRSQISDSDTVGFDLDSYVEDLHALINSTGSFDAHLVGHAIGAQIAALCARRHPQDARSLTLVNASMRLYNEDELSSLIKKTQASVVLREVAHLPFLRNLVAWRYREAPEPFRTRLFTDFVEANPQAAYNLAVSACEPDRRKAFIEALGSINLPVLLVRGEKEKLAGEEETRQMMNQTKQGQAATIRGAGHLPMLKFPEQFARLLVQFFSERLLEGKRSLREPQ